MVDMNPDKPAGNPGEEMGAARPKPSFRREWMIFISGLLTPPLFSFLAVTVKLQNFALLATIGGSLIFGMLGGAWLGYYRFRTHTPIPSKLSCVLHGLFLAPFLALACSVFCAAGCNIGGAAAR